MQEANIQQLAQELSLADIRRLLSQKEKEGQTISKLLEKRRRLLGEIAGIENEIERLSSSEHGRQVSKKGRKRSKAEKGRMKVGISGKTARELALEFLSSKEAATLSEIVEHVASAKGRKSTLGDKATVGSLLAKDPGVERVERGVYRLVGNGR